MVAFVPKGRGAIDLGDPVGPPDDFADTVRGFQQFCRANDWSPGFYQALPDHLDIYRHLGMRAIKIGEEAIVDLRTFSTKGRTGQDFRSALNKLTKSGHHVDFHAPPLEPALLQELRQISEEWLAIMHGSEKRFSVGWFDEAYLADCEIAVVRDSGGVISAFANLVPEYQLNEITIDLMRHRRSMVHGTMGFPVPVSALQRSWLRWIQPWAFCSFGGWGIKGLVAHRKGGSLSLPASQWIL